MQKINADGTTEVEKTTRQDKPNHVDGRFAPGNNANPTGKGGFGTNPQNRSNGKWKKENSISYQYNRLLAMTEEEYNAFKPVTNAEKIAKRRIERAIRDDDESLKETKEITDRTEGRAKQDISIEADEKAAPLIRGFVIPTLPEGYIDEQIAKARTNNE